MGEQLQTDFNPAGYTEAMGEDDLFGDLAQELEGDGSQRLEREETIRRLGDYYGGQLFKYGSHTGTVNDIIDVCPAAGVVVAQGFDAMVGWIDSYKIDTPAEESKPAEEHLEVETTAPEQDGDVVPTKQTTEKPVTALVKPKVGDANPVQQLNTRSDNLSNTPLGPEAKAIPRYEKPTTTTEDTSVKESTGDTHEPIEVTRISRSPQEISQPKVPAEATLSSPKIKDFLVEKESETIEPIAEVTADTPLKDNAPARELPSVELIASPEEPKVLATEVSVVEPEELINTAANLNSIRPDDDSELVGPSLANINEVHTDEADDEPPTQTVTEIFEHSIIDDEETSEDRAADRPIIVTELEPTVVDQIKTETEIGAILENLTDIPDSEPSAYNPAECEKQTARVLVCVQELQHATSAEECNEALAGLHAALRDLLSGLGYDNPDDIADRIIRQYDMETLHAIVIRLQALMRRNATTKPPALVHSKHRVIGYHAVRLLVRSVSRQLHNPQTQVV